ncbi:hypothetical protein IWQ60_006974 [Tieghemiomyces parasiticus]|uniref:Uncharacterized protein n=1 Tax=Tieghemiomyces parasiticus TaxID=78921 RepID=A0A9W8DS19_9FUNG|nr:hypothetical protein IWQ60_006974 [Tieghemiomyces parasiticus]
MRNVLHRDLKLHSYFNCWIPHNLTNNQYHKRVHFATVFLEKFDGVSDYLLDSIVTGNGTWVYRYDSPLLALVAGGGALKVALSQLRPAKVTPHPSAKPPGVKVSAKLYVEYKLKPMAQACEEVHGKPGPSSLWLHHDNAPPHHAAAAKTYISTSKVKLIPAPLQSC